MPKTASRGIQGLRAHHKLNKAKMLPHKRRGLLNEPNIDNNYNYYIFISTWM